MFLHCGVAGGGGGGGWGDAYKVGTVKFIANL